MIGPRNWGFPRTWEHPEALRRRRQQEPQRRPDPKGERGVVLCPSWRVTGLESPADFALLRRLLLYWDAVVWPQFGFIDEEADGVAAIERLTESLERARDPDLSFLEHAGVLDLARTLIQRVSPRAGPPTQQEVRTSQWRWQETVYANCDYREPGQWAMAQATGDFSAPDIAHTIDGALGSLTNLLPEPAGGVTFQEILDFRRQNREALKAIRMLLDELAVSIQQNPVSALGYNHAHRRLDQAVGEIWVKAREQQFVAQRMAFGSVFAMLKDAIAGAWAGIGAAPVVHYPIAETAITTAGIGAVLGVATSLEGFTLSRTKLAQLTGMPSYAAYLLAARDQGIVEEPKKDLP
jgi:hypothetical protein